MKQILVIVIVILISCVSVSDTYYMDAEKPAGGDGKSPQTAWKTVDEALSYLNSLSDKGAGDTVILAAGDYIHFKQAFVSRTDWLTFKAAETGTAVFSNGIQVGDYGDLSTFYLRFEGFTVYSNPSTNKGFYAKCSDWNLTESASHLEIVNCRFLGPGYQYTPTETWNAAISLLGISHVTVDGCSIEAETESGIPDGWMEGIGLPNRNSNYNWVTHDIVIKNTEIQDCRFGMNLKGKDIWLINNHIHEIGDDGIRIGYAENMFFIGNEIHDIFCPTDTDWHNDCIQVTPYKQSHTFNNVVFTQNVCYNTGRQIFFFEHFVSAGQKFYIVNNTLIGKPQGWALAVENMNDIVVANNTIHGMARFKDTTNYKLYNNVFGGFSLTDPENSGVDNNNIYRDPHAALTGDNNFYLPSVQLLMGNPVYNAENLDGFDYSFAITDPAINPALANAIPLSEIITDWPLTDVPLNIDMNGTIPLEVDRDGTPRKSCPDIGAYEIPDCGCRSDNPDDTPTAPTTDASAKWTFSETGNIAKDSSANGIDGILVNVERREAGSIYFNGTNSYIDCGQESKNKLNLGPIMTISAWIKIEDFEKNAYMRIFSKKAVWDAPNGYELQYNPQQNYLSFLGSSRNTAKASFDINDTEWHHIAAVVNADQVTLYVDGYNVTTDSDIDPIVVNDVAVQIGRQSGNADYFKGYIGEVALYNKFLSDAEIRAIADKGHVEPDNTDITVSHYQFDDMQGDTVTDSSDMNLDGISLNAPSWGIAWMDSRQEWLTFDGSSQAVEIQADAIQVESGTLAIWAEPATGNDSQFLFGHVLDESNRIWLYTVAGQLALGMGDNTALATDIAALRPNQQYHIALTWNAGSYAVYVNGLPAASGVYSGLNSLAATADIANMGTANYRSHEMGFDGIIDDVQIFRNSLSADEITALFQTYYVKANCPIAIQLDDVDPDGNPVSFTANSLPAGAGFDTNTQQFTWRPWYTQSGTHDINFQAQDGTQQTITISTGDVVMSNWYRDFLIEQGKL
ncbi:MAG: LamG-like jellyroll fold domain-containing protein [Planctomycetota bacterium]